MNIYKEKCLHQECNYLCSRSRSAGNISWETFGDVLDTGRSWWQWQSHSYDWLYYSIPSSRKHSQPRVTQLRQRCTKMRVLQFRWRCLQSERWWLSREAPSRCSIATSARLRLCNDHDINVGLQSRYQYLAVLDAWRLCLEWSDAIWLRRPISMHHQ
jgi:hypothetical protein